MMEINTLLTIESSRLPNDVKVYFNYFYFLASISKVESYFYS